MDPKNILAHSRFHFVTYMKTRALKQLFQWLLVAGISIILLSSFAIADAYALAPVDSDIEGAGLIVDFGDSGVLNFDLEPPTASYAAEVYWPGTSSGGVADDFELRGWVWNDNLGWISLYCDGGMNNGVACGAVDYGVKVDLNNNGEMYGWAWADNIGWISFSCDTSGGTPGNNDGSLCGDYDYNTQISIDFDATLGDITGFAWADTVGWFNMTGASANLFDMMLIESDEADWGIWTKAENGALPIGDGARDFASTQQNAPVADGSDKHDIFVHIADINGNPLGAGLTIDIVPQWADTVRWDQIDGTSEPAHYNDITGGPVIKPLGILDFTAASPITSTAGVSGSYYDSVTSYAPTDGMNCFDGSEPADYDCLDAEDFIYNQAAHSNNLTYLGAEVTITMGVNTWGPTTLLPLNNSVMDFLPAIDMTTFNYMLPKAGNTFEDINYIESFRNVVDSFNVNAVKRGVFALPYAVDFILESSDASVNYGWIADSNSLPAEDGSDSSQTYTDVSLIPNPFLALPYAATGQLAGQVEDPLAYSKVMYKVGFNTVKYFNNRVPRRSDAFIINQAAEILSGQVYSPGAEQVTSNIVISSIGDLATNKARNDILANVSSLKAGAKTSDYYGEKAQLGEGSNYSLLGGGKGFFYKNADLYIDKAGIEWAAGVANKEPFTIIVEDGDIFIEEDIDLDIPVGLIALSDLRAANEKEAGGRVYVGSEVVDMVNVFIYADGPMFRYIDGICYSWDQYVDNANLSGLREPNFVESGRCSAGSIGSYQNPVGGLTNQFYFKGTLSSQNCIGCSALDATELYRGDGKLVVDGGSPNVRILNILRLYDLNYFGYFRVNIDGNPSGKTSAHLDAVTQQGPIYFDYATPPDNLPGFSN